MKAAARALYHNDPAKKRAAVGVGFRMDPDKKKATARAVYRVDPSKKKAAAKALYHIKRGLHLVSVILKTTALGSGHLLLSQRGYMSFKKARYILAQPKPGVKDMYLKDIQLNYWQL